MIMKMQLNITLKCLIMNILIIKKKSYLDAKERYNINLKRTLKTSFDFIKNNVYNVRDIRMLNNFVYQFIIFIYF